MNNIDYSDLADTDIVQVIDLDDYFGSQGPHAKEPMTKAEFEKEYMGDCGEEFDFEQWQNSAGDGQSNFCLATIRDGAICVVW